MKLSKLIKIASQAEKEYGDIDIVTEDWMAEGSMYHGLVSSKVVGVNHKKKDGNYYNVLKYKNAYMDKALVLPETDKVLLLSEWK